MLLRIVHVIPDQYHCSSQLLLRSSLSLTLCTPILLLKVIFLVIIDNNKCVYKVRKNLLFCCVALYMNFNNKVFTIYGIPECIRMIGLKLERGLALW